MAFRHPRSLAVLTAALFAVVLQGCAGCDDQPGPQGTKAIPGFTPETLDFHRFARVVVALQPTLVALLK